MKRNRNYNKRTIQKNKKDNMYNGTKLKEIKDIMSKREQKSILKREQNQTYTEKAMSVMCGTKLRNTSYNKQDTDREMKMIEMKTIVLESTEQRTNT